MIEYINIIDNDDVSEKEEWVYPPHIDQSFKSDIDKYIEKFEGVPQTKKRRFINRVQKQTIRFGDDASLQGNVIFAMLLPLTIYSRRRDDFDGLDDYTIPVVDSKPYPQYKESFAECLRKYLICKNLDDNFVYENANLNQQQWTTIISNKDFKPDKHIAIAIALALHLDMDETMDLLQAAELELSRDHVFDLIIEYSINNELYDVLKVNKILFEFRQPLLC